MKNFGRRLAHRRHARPEPPKPPPVIRCSFCGEPTSDTRILVGDGSPTSVRHASPRPSRYHCEADGRGSGDAMTIDLLDIDLTDGKHWIDRVIEELRAQRLAEIRARHRAAWLRRQGRHLEASNLIARLRLQRP